MKHWAQGEPDVEALNYETLVHGMAMELQNIDRFRFTSHNAYGMSVPEENEYGSMTAAGLALIIEASCKGIGNFVSSQLRLGTQVCTKVFAIK